MGLTKTITLSLLAAALTLAGCKKKEETPPASSNSNNTTGGTGGTFTPPTTNYYMIDTTNHSSSADAFSCNLNGGDVGVVKSFSNGVYSAHLHISFPQNGSSSPRDINSQIAEGAYAAFDLDSVGKASNQAYLQLDFQYNGEYYYMSAKSGKLYVSKLNGKLRYTSDGQLNVNGPKWIGSGFQWNFTRKLKFSIECGAQF
jgi:hypothetical protein